MRLRTLGAVCATSAVAAPLPLVPTASAQELPAPPPVAAAVPGDLRSGAIALLSDRHVHFARRHHRLQGDSLSRAERRSLRLELAQLTPRKLSAQTRELRGDIRGLRRRLERKAATVAPAAGGSPAGGVAPHLAAIAACESGGDPRAISPGGDYRGKYQFSVSTWQSVGGSGDPAAASEGEQNRRAAILYRTGGAGHWPVCGR